MMAYALETLMMDQTNSRRWIWRQFECRATQPKVSGLVCRLVWPQAARIFTKLSRGLTYWQAF